MRTTTANRINGRRRSGVVLALVMMVSLALAAFASSGYAATNPSLDQYVESVPTSHGDRPHGGGGGGHAQDLPPAVQSQIREQGGSDADELEAIATSPALGAPQASGRKGSSGSGHGGSGDSQRTRSDEGGGSGPSTLDAISTAAGDAGGGSAGAWLLGGLIGLTLGMTALTLVRRRNRA